MKTITRFLLPLLLLPLTSAFGAEKNTAADLDSYEPWPEEAVQAFEQLLIQDGGRVKPIYTYARFRLMQYSGRTKLTFVTNDGEEHTISHTEWLMDVLLRGEVASEIPTFIVDDSAVVVRIDVSPESKRDRYSYAQLLNGRGKLAQLAAEYQEKQEKYENSEKDPQYELNRIESMVLTLGRNISSYEYLLGQFGYARKGQFHVNEDILPDDLKELSKTVDMAEMLERMPEMTIDQLVQMVRQQTGDTDDERIFAGAMRLFFFHASSGRGLAIIPPKDNDQEQWISIGDAMISGLESKEDRPWALEQMRALQSVVESAGTEGFAENIKKYTADQKEAALSRDEGVHSKLEVKMYEGKYFTNALVFFILGFIVLSLALLSPGSRYGRTMVWIACAIALVGLVLDVTGITMRCIIRQRPPITNLYDTVLFITGAAVLLGLLLELFTRIGIGALVALVSGVAGMFLSIKYEAKEATDTISQLVAVLDTNFWLATHVTIINLGYAAAMVSGLIGILYLSTRLPLMLFAILTKKEKKHKEFYRTITRMNYGIICFCLLFSLVGTVLGGIWANYSWGRFWGWDPKENGALMICLWSLFILHGRMGGFIREVGIHMNAVVLAGITTFSWWGVNNLGVGLHSYGFTDGVWLALIISWGVMFLFILMGVPLWFIDKVRKNQSVPQAAS